ncbi:hypothetical protein D9M71_542980 [compost metagenome]
MRDLFLVLLAYRCILQKCPGAFIGVVRVIHGKHDPVRPHCLKGVLELRQVEHPAGRDVDIVLHVIFEVVLHRRCRGGEECLDTLHIERDQFAPMAHDHLQIRVAIENARKNQSHDMHADLVVPANSS